MRSRIAGVARILRGAARVGNPSAVARARTREIRVARGFHSSNAALKVIPFNLPDIGEGIAEVRRIVFLLRTVAFT